MTAPTKMALVPAEATEEMARAMVGNVAEPLEWGFQGDYARMLEASPSSGRLTAADLERAAEAHYRAGIAQLVGPLPAWREMTPTGRNRGVARMRAAFAAIGLQVEGEPSDV